MNMQTTGCDHRRIDDFLNSEQLGFEDEELFFHLGSCDTCREYMETQAARPNGWSEAAELLQPSGFDVAGSDACSMATFSSEQRNQPVAIQNVIDSLAPSDDPHRLGRLGAYEISGIVGAGGMGVVLKAVDPSLDRIVAIKVLAPNLANSENARLRFSREAKAAAAVLHPNVIPIHGVSSDVAMPYLVMAYIRGGSLQKRLEREGPLSTVEILRIGSQIAAGLAAAHGQGLVHRDIKPENIMLEEGVERVTLTDFGLARAVDDASVTREGTIAGTPQFMSPEQARGEAVDHQSDLFSFGSVLYALCTGRLPFRAESSFGVMRRISDESPTPIRELNPEIPEWLCSIIETLMAKDKAERFESAAELQELMESCLSHLQQPTAIPLPKAVLTLRKDTRLRHRFLRRSMARFALGGILMTMTAAVILLFLAGGNPLAYMMMRASEDTEYASDYSEQAFQKVKIGDSIESVEAKIGKPLSISPVKPYTAWLYAPDKHPSFAAKGESPPFHRACNVITFDKDGKFTDSHGQSAGTEKRVGDDALVLTGEISFQGAIPGPLGLSDEKISELKQKKTTQDDFRKRFGEPRATYTSRSVKWLRYSRSPASTHYRKRMLGVDEQGRVCEKKSEFYWD